MGLEVIAIASRRDTLTLVPEGTYTAFELAYHTHLRTMRIGVVDKNHSPLMPTKPSRVRRWLKSGKAVKRWSDVGLFYVQLTVDPSDVQLQPVTGGIGPGKLYSGIGVQSAKATLFIAHLVLPFENVKKGMETRAMMRRTRRSRRINRSVKFELRNHRQKRFSNRRGQKVPPSIRANRQLELRVFKELQRVFPISKVYYEIVKADVDKTSGRKKAKSGKGFSPVMVGQNWMVSELSKLCEVVTQQGWDTASLRRQLGLTKSKEKSDQTPEARAVDGISLACADFVRYQKFHKRHEEGAMWLGSVSITESVFSIIRRPPISRRQLHLLQFAQKGVRRKYGGTVTGYGVRKGDIVTATMGARTVVRWVSGDTENKVSVSNHDWKRSGQFTASKVKLLKRSTGLVVNRSQASLLSTG